MPDQFLLDRLAEKKSKIEGHLADVNAAIAEAEAAPDPEPEGAPSESTTIVNADPASGAAETGI